ncbi:hypothetical protein BN1723_015326 [Verticillium longisporum]|uniref:TOG domain-containing protein n=2 Tax=Verticillium longisporum TaxID=100787 RepID=A0A0G4MW35_VERLO|nr:hypothetical protein BN1723_015326 [Verticillium longisporum]
MIRQLEVLAGYVERAKETKTPVDPRDLEDSAIKDFVQKLDKVKETMSEAIEALHEERDELAEEKNKAIADRDRALLEFEQLSSKNAQLADMNNDLTHQIQERFKSQIGDLKSPSGLGIYSQNKGLSGSSLNLAADPQHELCFHASQPPTTHADFEPLTVCSAAEVGKLGRILLAQERAFVALSGAPATSFSHLDSQHAMPGLIALSSDPRHASMVGSYEESILRGRMSTNPSKPLDFLAQIGVLGLGKFNRPEDAQGFLESRGGVGGQPGVDADEETRRRQREELMYWNAIHLSKLEFQKKADEQASPAAQLPAATEGSSFDDFLRQDASGESNSFVFKTGANVNEGEAQVRRRNEGARGLAAAAAAAALANPFDDEYRIDPVELFDNANNVAPHHDDSMSDIYSATTRDADDAPPNLSVALSTATPDLIDVTTDNDTATERSTTLDRELDQDEYMTAGQDQDDRSASEAYASIQAWAQGSSSNFYSPLPMSPTAPISKAPPAAAATSAATTRPRPESTVSGGMSVRPMRPTKKRPEQPQRPATAGPYSVRTHEGPSAEASSPQSLKSRTNTPKAKIETPPRRVPPRTRPGHASHVSESSLPSPTAKPTATKTAASPRVSPAKPQPSPRVSPAKPAHAPITLASSPSKANEELTLLVPSVESLSLKDPSPAPEEQEQPPEVEPASPEPPVPVESVEPEVPASPQVAPASPEIVVQSPQKEISATPTSALPSERPITPAPDVRTDKAEPSYVNTQRELEDMLRDMHLHFEGRESEQNWLKREESVKKLRRLIAGNVAQDFREPFLLGLKALLDGIIKAVNSLRTSLSKEGCALVQDIAHAFGPGMDPLVELLMQTFIKLCAATKKIASQQANVTVDAIVGRASYNSRIMQHVWGACQDKNVQPRTYAADWLQTILKKEGHHKSHIEHNGGVELFEKCIKKGLNDSNPGVREKMRGTYWAFATYWPARAEVIMENLDATAQKLLNKDSHNPSVAKKVEEGPVRPGMGLSRSTMATSSKPSLREAMLAQKKAMSGRNMPARPGSAMAHISPARTVSSSSNAPPAAAATSAATTRPRPESTVSGGMSVRPMRPTKKRPEQPQRPATAGPYSVRTHEGSSAEASSPQSLKSRTNTPKAKIETPPRRVPPRTRPGHASHVSESSLPSPTAKPTAMKTTASPRVSPAKPQPSPRASPAKPAHAPITLASSPSKANEELTLLVPSVESLSLKDRSPAPEEQEQPSEVELANLEPPVLVESAVPEVPTSPRVAPASPEIVVQSPQKEMSTTPSKTLKVFEDPFTEEDQTTPKPVIVIPVLEDRPVNENAGVPAIGQLNPTGLPESPDKSRQNTKLLESGITRVKARSLDVHGFRKLQTLIRENRAVFTDEKFDALLTGLFEFLEAPLETLAPEKVQDVKAQILATVKLLLKKERDSFQPHVARGLEALVASRSAYDSRTHIVSGLELLAAELVTIGDAPEMVMTMTKLLGDSADSTTGGCRCLSMGLHILKEVLEKREGYVPSEGELGQLAGLAGRCLESAESGVRMGAVQLCVALHARIGDGPFWEAVKTTKDDPKNLITYYIAKRQREQNGVSV